MSLLLRTGREIFHDTTKWAAKKYSIIYLSSHKDKIYSKKKQARKKRVIWDNTNQTSEAENFIVVASICCYLLLPRQRVLLWCSKQPILRQSPEENVAWSLSLARHTVISFGLCGAVVHLFSYHQAQFFTSLSLALLLQSSFSTFYPRSLALMCIQFYIFFLVWRW